ncbi:MAG: ribonuclease III [Desulfamplus sp.]|nr:ribonuclease III [Desulfamplus sp.]
MIDLHIHSTASDGSFTPVEIVNMAINRGLSAISITDHDTIDGVKEAIEAGIPHNIEFITGVELSVQPPLNYEDSGSIHILGYGFSIYDKEMNAKLIKLKDARANRNPLILERLGQLGFPLTMSEVIDICGEGQIGRPHIAKAMVEKGYVPSFDYAFDNYLGKGKAAYIDKFKLSCKDAIKLILDAGGIPVLAHPGLIKIKNSSQVRYNSDSNCPNINYSTNYSNEYYPLEYFISQLIGMGLMGIEVFHTDHSKEETNYFEKFAKRKALLITGGSDFHGTLKQGVEIGIGKVEAGIDIDKVENYRGNLSISFDYYKNLYIAVEKTRRANSNIEKLQDNFCYSFKEKSLLETALRHSSYVNETQSSNVADNQRLLDNQRLSDNQRLEFLGDAVLGLSVAQLLMQKFPDMKEGDLSKLRSNLVSESSLASMARAMDVGRFILLGKGERLSRGAEKNSILADTFEAIIAAIFLEIGFEATCELISLYFDNQISQITSVNDTCDYKSMLQEMVQEMGNFAPCYKIVKEIGPDHDKMFEVVLNVCDIEATGEGKNKKSAEQNAAANAITILNKGFN